MPKSGHTAVVVEKKVIARDYAKTLSMKIKLCKGRWVNRVLMMLLLLLLMRPTDCFQEVLTRVVVVVVMSKRRKIDLKIL